ncbi:IclR family transcriptional regulator domain-containing protein [Comamonas serinivorans]|uniref:IclR family transcriptional regulator domain-containing protein n=1 Tax=Comamonas serinivorans TaxID=1082851 RepID=UPI001F013E53|nr:IclR family transcriptional regulator C-terminal domain-containing protein [Comamonas serinivorans]
MAGSADSAGEQRPSDSYVQSFARGLAVIRAFTAQAPAHSLTSMAAATGLTRAGARRILLTLQALGYVDSDGRLFRLTPRILDLGFAYLSTLPLWNLAEPVMEDLSEAMGESSSASVLDGADIVYVLRVSTRKIMRVSLGTGSRLPAYCTSMGRVLLAGLPPDAARELLQATPRPQHTASTVTEVEAILARVDEARRQGWCLVDQELEEGLISLAAPIVNRSGQTIAAINLSGQANRTRADAMRERMVQPLLAAARHISSLLQNRPA